MTTEQQAEYDARYTVGSGDEEPENPEGTTKTVNANRDTQDTSEGRKRAHEDTEGHDTEEMSERPTTRSKRPKPKYEPATKKRKVRDEPTESSDTKGNPRRSKRQNKPADMVIELSETEEGEIVYNANGDPILPYIPWPHPEIEWEDLGRELTPHRIIHAGPYIEGLLDREVYDINLNAGGYVATTRRPPPYEVMDGYLLVPNYDKRQWSVVRT